MLKSRRGHNCEQLPLWDECLCCFIFSTFPKEKRKVDIVVSRHLFEMVFFFSLSFSTPSLRWVPLTNDEVPLGFQNSWIKRPPKRNFPLPFLLWVIVSLRPVLIWLKLEMLRERTLKTFLSDINFVAGQYHSWAISGLIYSLERNSFVAGNPRQLWQTTILLIGRKTFRLSQLVTKTWILLKITQINSFLASRYLRVGEFSMKFALY